MRDPFSDHAERVYCQALVAILGADPAAQDAQARLVELEPATRSPTAPMLVLASKFGLTPLAIDFIWAVTALALDPRLIAHAEALDGPLARRGMSAALFTRIANLDRERGQRLARWLLHDNALIDCGLLSIGDPHALSVATPIAPSPRLIAFLAGEIEIGPGVRALERPSFELVHDEAQRSACDELRQMLARTDDALIVVEGHRGSGRRTVIAAATPRRACAIRARFDNVSQQDEALRLLSQEATLAGAIPVLADLALGSDPHLVDSLRGRLEEWIRRTRGLIVITTSDWTLDLDLDRPVFRLRWPIPDVDTRRELWRSTSASFGISLTGDLETLSLQYRVGPGGIRRALGLVMNGRSGELSTSDVVAGIRHNVAERLGGLARRVEVRQGWQDLVLAEDIRDQVEALIARVRHAYVVLETWQYRRKLALGQGIASLFSGPPGTGKTMVAGLIAAELGLDLYQVDLSQVVSKWVGETEKQLARVFEAAEEGHALLLFDEADALFGQRSTEMRGATDRYANLEVNYLLQRIESFGGLTILTTNLDASIDKALKRRLAAHIVFAAPDEDERQRLWETLAKTDVAPLGRSLDFEELARDFPTMTGANIRNAALAAAFLAASGGARTIEQEHLLRAARAEYRSMGHVLAERSAGRLS